MVKNWNGLVLACLSSQVFASGFQLQEQNVTNLGLAYSGTAALAQDASTAFYNPAGLVCLENSQVVLAGMFIQTDLDFSPAFLVAPDGSAVNGAGASPGTSSGVGALYLSKPIDDNWAIGFSVNSPFGLTTDYDNDSIARYVATDSKLQVLDLSPNLAYRILPCLSIGAGADAYYVKATLNTQVGEGVPATDDSLHQQAEGWGYGWHGGILYEPFLRTRLGLNYRSHAGIHLDGNTRVTVPVAPPPLQNGFFFIRTISTETTFPSTATFSLYQGITDLFAVTADVAWTNWSQFDALTLDYAPTLDGRINSTTTLENFEDTWRVALGLIVTPSDCWTFRFGGAWDETPVQNEFRTARLPDGDRIWVALGGQYAFTPCWYLDFGYAHIFVSDVAINEGAPLNAATGLPVSATRFSGNYESASVNVVGIQIRYDFV